MLVDNVGATDKLKQAMSAYLRALGEDPDRDGLLETPHRFVKQLHECLAGYQDDPVQHIKVFDNDNYRDLVTVRDITFSSLCEHHMLPFFGTIDVAYLPTDKILGLSKFARVVDAISKRLQVQERMTKEIADLLESGLKPQLLIVKVSAKHTCMGIRGVRRPNSITDTVVMRGDTHKYARYIEQLQYLNKERRNDIHQPSL